MYTDTPLPSSARPALPRSRLEDMQMLDRLAAMAMDLAEHSQASAVARMRSPLLGDSADPTLSFTRVARVLTAILLLKGRMSQTSDGGALAQPASRPEPPDPAAELCDPEQEDGAAIAGIVRTLCHSAGLPAEGSTRMDRADADRVPPPPAAPPPAPAPNSRQAELARTTSVSPPRSGPTVPTWAATPGRGAGDTPERPLEARFTTRVPPPTLSGCPTRRSP